MTRWLVILAVLLAVAFVALLLWPRGERTDSVSGSQSTAVAGTAAAERFTVLVDGREVGVRQEESGMSMADLPVTSWSTDMISHTRSLGTTSVVVFVDGSESVINDFILERMPQDVAFRTGYSRGN